MVEGFRCSMECYGDCGQCRGIIQQIGTYEELDFFRKTLKWHRHRY